MPLDPANRPAPVRPALAVRRSPPLARPDPIEEASASGLLQALAAGRLNALSLSQQCLARIAALDRRGPRLNSVIELNPDALDIARALDAERQTGKLSGPLHGLPVLLKDNIATGDRMGTSAGSLALDGVRAVRDAHLVTRLRAAGAVLLGKTNLSEWANIRSTRSTSGWSGRGGLTRNPYALDRSTGGSSSGTAAAVAASLAPLGVGTETDGSIVSPASLNGVVGLKPTLGRISRDGVIPIAHSQDAAGPMARSVADAALLYAVMTGPDPLDAITTDAPANEPQPLSMGALRGARLGVARAFRSGFDEVNANFDRAVADLRAQGAEIVDDIGLPLPAWRAAERSVLLHELKADLALWLATFAPHAPVHTLADVIAFNRKHREREMPWFGQELFEQAQALGGLDSPAYLAARAECLKGARDEGLARAFDEHGLDAIIAPTTGVAWLIDPVAGDHHGNSFAGPAAVAGWPHLTVPAGFVRGLPAGLSFVGPPFSEWRLLGLGHAYEQATKHRRAPRFVARSVPA
jgi:amidase